MFKKKQSSKKDYLGEYEHHTAENEGDYVVKSTQSRTLDILLKLLSVMAAFILWFYVAGVESPTYETSFTGIQVGISANDSSLAVISGYNNTVDITVQGKKSEINKISADDIEAYVDISSIDAAGRYTLPIQVNVPGTLKVSSLSVSTVSVYLDSSISTITVPVKANLISYVLEDGEIGMSDMTVNIDEVSVSGPETVLQTIECARVDVSLGTVTSSVTAAGTLKLVDSNGDAITNPYVKLSQTEAVVSIPVYFTKKVPLTVSYKYGFFTSKTASVTISPQYIEIKGEADTLSAIDSIQLTTLDEKKVTTDTITQKISLPSGVTNVSGIEEAVITVEHIGTSTKDVVVSSFDINNSGEINYELLTDSINVTLRGETQYLSYVRAEDIQASVDLSCLGEASGVTSVPVTITILNNYSEHVYELGDYKISIRIN